MTLSTSNGSRTLLLTLDAFSTLFHPRLPVPEQYASTAHSFGISPSVVTPAKIQTAFKEAFKAQSKRWPNYGRQEVLKGRYGGPRQWWGQLIKGSFTRVIRADEGNRDGAHNEEDVPLPDGLVESLVNRFAGCEGYTLYPDVLPFFERLRALRATTGDGKPGLFSQIVVGVISNSDDRVPAVLKSLGLKVGNVRADQGRSSMELPGFEEMTENLSSAGSGHDNDVDMVITSYEAGEEKPHPLIFEITKRQAASFLGVPAEASNTDDWICVHVGDNYEQDYQGALNAGWKSFFIPRNDHDGHSDCAKIFTLDELLPKLEAYTRGQD